MPIAHNIYLDSNAVISFAEGEGDRLASFFVRILSSGGRFFTSELTLTEVLVVPLRERDQVLITAYDMFLQTDQALTVVPVNRAILRKSAEHRACLGGKGPDAIHGATADLSGCGIVISSDKRLRLPDGIVRIAVEDVEQIGLTP